MRRLSFLEFFAGGGMARLGLGPSWQCSFANDIDSQKCAAYRANFGAKDLIEGSICDLTLDDLPPDRSDLAWASFPCQDLSLAGTRGGMAAGRSGTFFEFWRLMTGLAQHHRAPRMIVLENVPGLLTSNNGKDFNTIIEMVQSAGYRVGAQLIDARSFTPQSRPRLFIVGFSDNTLLPPVSDTDGDEIAARAAPSHDLITLARPQTIRNMRLRDIIDHAAPWDRPERTGALLEMMSPAHAARVDALIKAGAHRIGSGFRRTRSENGHSTQRFEVRFDGIAGCLRTPAGGSSRQLIIEVRNGAVRSRLMTPIEAARLMGLPEDYQLPHRATAALKLCGDGVCVPAVRWLSKTILEPALVSAHAVAAA